MYYSNGQALENMVKGWTRVDMLLNLYERAIDTVEAASIAHAAGDTISMQIKTLEAQKFILGLHSGLKPDECEVAHSVAQLLGFVVLRMEEKNFAEAKRFLEKLHASFLQIRETAVELEANGVIPPIDEANVFEAMA